MGMREYPTTGHILQFSKFKQFLPADKLEECETGDDFLDLLQLHIPEELPHPEMVFILDDEDTPGEGMECGVWYVYFDELSLYEKKLTSAGQKLKEMVGLPSEETWSAFG